MRIARWIVKLQQYDFEIEHRHEKKHQNADALSRLPLNKIELTTNEDLIKLREDQLSDPAIGPVLRALEAGIQLKESGEDVKETRMMVK